MFLRVQFLALCFSPCILSRCLPLLTHTLSFIIHLQMTYNYRCLLPQMEYLGEQTSVWKAEDLGSSPSECQIFHLFRCVLSSVLPLRSVRRSNFDKGLHSLTTLNKKRRILIRTAVLYMSALLFRLLLLCAGVIEMNPGPDSTPTPTNCSLSC